MKKTNIFYKVIFIFFILLIIITVSNISNAAELTSNEYKITTINNVNYIIGIYQNTRAEDAKNNIKTESEIRIYNKEGQAVKDDAIIETGTKIQIGKQTYIAIVCGDVNGDGNVSLTDLVKIKMHLIGKEKLEGANGIASDVDASGKVTATDILNLKRLMVRIIEEREIFEKEYTNKEFRYKKNKLTDKITITELVNESESSTLQIPNKIDGNVVKEIDGFLGENSSITKVTISNEIEKISKTAFSGLTNLEYIQVSALNEFYTSKDGILYNKNKDTLVFYPRGKSDIEYIIEENVKTIGEYAFYKNVAIQKLYIPDTVEQLEKTAFEEMKGKVYVKEDSNIIAKLKERGIAYEIDGKPVITKLTSILGTNQTLTVNIEATDDVGIVAWSIALKDQTNLKWTEVTSTTKLIAEYKDINQKGIYVVRIKDNVGNIGSQEIIISEIDTTSPMIESIKIISPASGEYNLGQNIIIRVQFSEKIKGTAPILKLNIGETEVITTAINPTGTQDYIDYNYITEEGKTGEVSILSYSGGDITDLANNNATIIKLDNSGNKITIIPKEDMEAKVSSVILDKKSETLYLNSNTKTILLNATIVPSNAVNKKITWTSSNTSVATVNSSGKVTAKKPGTTIITVKTNDGGKTATFELTVKKKVIIIIGASQVTKMNTYAKTYSSKLYNYSTGSGTLNYIFKDGSGMKYQTGEGWNDAQNIINKYKSTKEYIDFYIFFPLVGNSIKNFNCSEITAYNNTIIGYARNYNNSIADLKNAGYNVQGYVTSMHPVNVKEAKYTDVVSNEDPKACKAGYRSNLKYHIFNKAMESIIESNYASNLKYEELFEKIMEINDEGKEYTFKINYKTSDGFHWNKATTITYVEMMFDNINDL